MFSIKYLKMDSRLKCNFTMLVVGPSGSGKSVFTSKLLQFRNKILAEAPRRIVWCYSVWQPLYDSLAAQIENLEFINGVPSIDLIKTGNFILVVDDLMDSADTAQTMSEIFTKYSHHYNVSCIFILQNLFPKFKQARTISLNAHYIVLMKNNRDKAQIRHLASQAFPENTRFLVESFEDATQNSFSYLLLDFKPDTSDKLRIRTNIFPYETTVVYLKL